MKSQFVTVSRRNSKYSFFSFFALIPHGNSLKFYNLSQGPGRLLENRGLNFFGFLLHPQTLLKPLKTPGFHKEAYWYGWQEM